MGKKIIFGILSFAIIVVVSTYIYINDTPPLPEGTEARIAQALKEEIPEFVKGKVDYAENDGIKIWYESIIETDSAKGTILLVMGHSGNALIWGRYFFQPLLDAGYQVIRYDNRGVGMSDWMNNWTPENAYDLEDMGRDAIAILDKENISKAHVVGMSMGGMIAQSLAINHSDRVKSLTSIMSSGYFNDPELPNDTKDLEILLFKNVMQTLIFPSDEKLCKLAVAIDQALAGEDGFLFDVKYLSHRKMYEEKRRRGSNPDVGNQHTAAIKNSGSRYEGLKKLKIPTLVVHGKTDPLVKFEHAQKYAPMIPNVETLYIDGMGHSIPPKYVPAITEGILRNIEKTKAVSEVLVEKNQ